MADVTIGNIAGGEDTSPANTSKIEIEVGGVSKFAQLVNILKNAIPIGGTTPAAGAFTTLKQTTGKAAGAIPISDVNGALTLTASTGSGAPVRATSPTIATPTITGAVTLTGGQIAFPATAVPSADPNTLDDYEEGTWTAELRGDTARATTPIETTGYYIKVGQLVTVSISFVNKDTTGATGQTQVVGLPFASLNESTAKGVSNVATYGLDIPGLYLVGTVATNGTEVDYLAPTDGGAWVSANIATGAGANKYLQATVVYLTNQ